MKKQYWWTKIPYEEKKKRKKSKFELLREFVYFYRTASYLDYEVANTINTYVTNFTVGGYFEVTNKKNTLINFCAYLNKTVERNKLGDLIIPHVIEFLKTYEEDILVD